MGRVTDARGARVRGAARALAARHAAGRSQHHGGDRAVMAPLEGVVGALIDAVGPQYRHGQRRAEVARLIDAERAPLRLRQDEAWDESPMPVARVCAELRALLPPDTLLVDHSTTAEIGPSWPRSRAWSVP